MKKIYLIITTFAFFAFFSCEEKKSTEINDSTKVDSTASTIKDANPAAVFASMKDSTNKAWDVMIKSDDQKIDDLARLLQEISYCKKYNVLLLDSLTMVVKTLKDKRYKQLTMTSTEIDAYDDLTNKIISRTKYLGNTTKDLSAHPIAETLFSDIATADNDVVRYRNLYDGFAFAYNNYYEANKEILSAQIKDFQKLPVFRLAL